MKKFLIIVGGGVIILLGFLALKVDDQEVDLVVPEVTIFNAVFANAQKEHVFGATVQNADEVVLSSQVGGVISEIFVQEGDKVKSGQMIVQIDADEYNAQYEQMKIALESAEQVEQLARRKWDDLKPEEREQHRLESERVRAVVAESAAHLRKLRVTAPFDSVVSSKFVSRGAVVAPGSDLVRIVGDATKKEVIVDIPIELGLEVEVGDVISVSNGKKNEKAKISSINPVADIQTRKMQIKIEMPANSSFGLGSFVDVHISTETGVSGVHIPFEAVVRHYDDNFIFVVGGEDVVKMQKVDLLSVEPDYVVASNVKEGEKVVVGGAHTLFDEDKVSVVGDIK